MTQEKISDDWVDLYNNFFRRDAHQLLAWGYEDARQKINADNEETDITGFIAEKIDNRLDDPNTPPRFDRYFLSEDKPISGEGRTGKSRRRLDLVIECSLVKPRPKYIFEAKRLCKGKATIGDYTGKEGIQRYVYGKYASQYPEAAMIGYVQSDNSDYWLNELQRKFDTDYDSSMYIRKSLIKVEVIPYLNNEWISEHDRTTGNIILVYHILLDCCTISFI
jgi:hypothetical protein